MTIMIAVFLILIVVSAIFAIFRQVENGAVSKSELQKVIAATGATQINIHNRHVRDMLGYHITYINVQGEPEARNVTRRVNVLGMPQGDFYWDKPLETVPAALPSPSKEQLVGEMSAEIERLQTELAAVKQNTQ